MSAILDMLQGGDWSAPMYFSYKAASASGAHNFWNSLVKEIRWRNKVCVARFVYIVADSYGMTKAVLMLSS